MPPIPPPFLLPCLLFTSCHTPLYPFSPPALLASVMFHLLPCSHASYSKFCPAPLPYIPTVCPSALRPIPPPVLLPCLLFHLLASCPAALFPCLFHPLPPPLPQTCSALTLGTWPLQWRTFPSLIHPRYTRKRMSRQRRR